MALLIGPLMTRRSHQLSRVLLLSMALTAAPALSDEQPVAATFSKAAIYVYSGDFVCVPVTEWFSKEELSILGRHQAELNAMIQDALAGHHSVGGALLTAFFKSEENIPRLRWRLFQPGTPYGWEGPDYDSEEDSLTDIQFVYHSVYLEAIEDAAGVPIYEAIQPTEEEVRTLFRLLENPSYDQYYWAKWLARKLRRLPSPR